MTTHEKAALKLQKALKALAGSDPTLEFMLNRNLPLTREMYLEMSYPEELPTPWTPELESEIPEPLQDWTQFTAASAIDQEDTVVRPMLISNGVPRHLWPEVPISMAQAEVLVNQQRSQASNSNKK